MPPVIPAHRALRDALRESVISSLQLNAILESVIHVKVRQAGTFHGKVDHSQPPWQAAVANAVMDLHALSREMEAWLRLSQGLPGRARGGSSGNTRKALENVVRLSEIAEDGTVRGHTRDLRSWEHRADIVLGNREMPKKLPRQPGEPERICPFCEKHTLRILPFQLNPTGEHVKCTNVTCFDEDGNRPFARLEFFGGDWVLRWQDGIIGVPPVKRKEAA